MVNNLFGEGQNPVGATIRVKNFPMKVIGVLSVKGQSSYGQDQDDVVIVPFNTAERKVLGVSAPQSTLRARGGRHRQRDQPLRDGADHQFGVQLDHRGDQRVRQPRAKITGVVNTMYIKASSSDQVDSAVAQITRELHAAPSHPGETG